MTKWTTSSPSACPAYFTRAAVTARIRRFRAHGVHLKVVDDALVNDLA